MHPPWCILFTSLFILIIDSFFLLSETFQNTKYPLTEWVYEKAALKYKKCVELVV